MMVLYGDFGLRRNYVFYGDFGLRKNRNSRPRVRLWEVASCSCSATLEGHSSRATSVAFSPDGRTLATGSDDKTARL